MAHLQKRYYVMCLFICPLTHQPSTKGLVAHRPLMVWKILRRAETVLGYRYFSPYREHEWFLGQEQSTIVRPYHGRIDAGLHAMIAGHRKLALQRFRNESGMDDYDLVALPAIIPMGSTYFIGDQRSHEVVSEELTVYADVKSLLKAHGRRKMGEAVPRAYLRDEYWCIDNGAYGSAK